jgi:thioredoxin 1
MGSVATVTDASFEQDVLKASLPTLVDVWAPWCGPCRMLSPIVEELSVEYAGRLNFRKLNGDDEPEIPSKYGVRGMPTLLLFKDGQLAGTIVGFRPKSALKKRIDELV